MLEVVNIKSYRVCNFSIRFLKQWMQRVRLKVCSFLL